MNKLKIYQKMVATYKKKNIYRDTCKIRRSSLAFVKMEQTVTGLWAGCFRTDQKSPCLHIGN